MTSVDVGARRVLHCCYSCSDADGAGAVFAGVGLRERMRTDESLRPGTLLGLDKMVRSMATFLYDERGPRTSPAIEVQHWVDPPAFGVPYETPQEVGLHAVGFVVLDAEAGAARLAELGCTVIGRVPGDAGVFDAAAVVLRDPRGVTIDLVDGPVAADSAGQLGSLRITCSDIERSLSWYREMGFAIIAPAARVKLAGAAFGLAEPSVELDVARLRLPDEPTQIVLCQWISPASVGRHYDRANHLGLYRVAVAVDDTRAAYAAACAAGWTFHSPPINRTIEGTNVPAMWIAITRDPDNIAFEFVERPRSAFRPSSDSKPSDSKPDHSKEEHRGQPGN